MKRIFLLLSLISLCINAYSQDNEDQILGIWLNDEGDAQILIYKESGKYYGKIVWLKEPDDPEGNPKTDKMNPDSELRDRPIMGLVLISDLEYKKGKWVNGTMYTPKKGKEVKCKIELKSDNEFKLTVSKGFFSASRTWTRL